MFKNDERYWDINQLNKWFGISSLIFLISMVWVFIDDNEDNVSAARTLGMNAVIYEGVQKLIESLEKFKIPINNSVLI